MSTIFIAVQCCQCLTMQVKQQKKSSNKWNCVICNQKQSVLKVFAQGFKARDVRKFVQGFNMSRKLVEENEDETPIPPFEEIDDPTLRKISHERKRRNDWTEYLDFEDTDRKEEEPEKVFASEPEIVTELPKEMFKKPKPKNYTTGLDNMEGNKPLKPVFSKRMAKPIIPQEKEEARECQTITAKGASKWSNYLTLEDEEDELLFEGGRRDLPDSGESWCQTLLQTHFNDQRVEDDVHPDFK